MSITLLKILLEAGGYEEDAAAFGIVDWYLQEYLLTSDELTGEAEALRELLQGVVKAWQAPQ
jgi:hypothetical protein